jgi:hypothetical protein
MYLFHDDMVWSTWPTTTGVARCLLSVHSIVCNLQVHACNMADTSIPSIAIDRLIPGRLPVYCWWSLLSSDMPKHRSICLEYLMDYMHVSCLGFFSIVANMWSTRMRETYWEQRRTRCVTPAYACLRPAWSWTAFPCVSPAAIGHHPLCPVISYRLAQFVWSSFCVRPPFSTLTIVNIFFTEIKG